MSLLPVGFGSQGEYTIEESLRFNASQSSYLSRSPSSQTNRGLWTWSGWVKRGALGSLYGLFGAGNASNNWTGILYNNENLYFKAESGGVVKADVYTSAVFRDPSAWYHVIVVLNTSEASSTNRVKIYVNGVQQTLNTNTAPSGTSGDYVINSPIVHSVGSRYLASATSYLDGYLTEVNFIDGQALDPTYFGETDAITGVWKPKGYTGTYGTNGFYLPMKLDNTVEGFNTVTYVGTGSNQQITGAGFSPDLVWLKARNYASGHALFDTVRGASQYLGSEATTAESTLSNSLTSFDSDGFSLSTNTGVNRSGTSFVAWCWDAGSSTVSNTDGSITSSVRANPAYGFSVVSYTGNGSAGATWGHGLGVAPSMVIIKNRSATGPWMVYHTSIGNTGAVFLNITNATITSSTYFNNTTPTSDVFSIGDATACNGSGNSIVAYCFSEVAGYSKFGSYTGTGASGNTVTTGFKPAFVMVKAVSGGNAASANWCIFDNTRNVDGGFMLRPNLSNTEYTGYEYIDFTDTGFTHNAYSDYNVNESGTTYIYMAFKDTREYAYWLDDSGNNNDWQPNGGITTSSTVTDTPTHYEGGGNYAVLNPLSTNAGFTLSNANLDYSESGAISACRPSPATIAMSSGKWYWEVNTATVGGGNYTTLLGIWDATSLVTSYTQNRVNGYAYATNGDKVNSSATAAYGSAMSNGDVIGIAFDADSGTIEFFKNNTSQGTAFTGISGSYVPVVCFNSGTTSYSMSGSVNFGQRPFAYTPPTGFKPLHTGNLPDSAIVDGSKYFNAVTYTGTGSQMSITGFGFTPDFFWNKSRSSIGSNAVNDIVRGADARLNTESTGAETTESGFPVSYDADGVTLNSFITSGKTYVLWGWKANGAGVSNTDGSITSTVSANPTAGFSIVTYTGTGANATVGHGLGDAPSMYIIKSRDAARNWLVHHSGLTAYNYTLNLNDTSAQANNDKVTSAPTSQLLNLSASNLLNGSGENYIAYCFADVEGFSKFGSYTGNTSTDGPFVYTGFKPSFIILKRTDAAGYNWFTLDAERNTYNVLGEYLNPNTSSAAASASWLDFVSNGFKLRATSSGINTGTIIYMAFAENPFKNSLAR